MSRGQDLDRLEVGLPCTSFLLSLPALNFLPGPAKQLRAQLFPELIRTRQG